MSKFTRYFEMCVKSELIRARTAHPVPIHSLHEGYAVLLEEVNEFWAQVQKRTDQRDPVNILEELAQIAAMAQRIAEDVVDHMEFLAPVLERRITQSDPTAGGQA